MNREKGIVQQYYNKKASQKITFVGEDNRSVQNISFNNTKLLLSALVEVEYTNTNKINNIL